MLQDSSYIIDELMKTLMNKEVISFDLDLGVHDHGKILHRIVRQFHSI